MTSCLENQKQEMKLLKELFSSDDEKVFRITSSNLDEIECEFIVDEKNVYRLHVDFPSTYPLNPPLWSLEGDNEHIQKVLDMLSSTEGIDNRILSQVRSLIEKLCFHFSLPLPEPEMKQLNSYFAQQQNEPSTSKPAAIAKLNNNQTLDDDLESSDDELPDDQFMEIDNNEKCPKNDLVQKADMIRQKLDLEDNNNFSKGKETSKNATTRIMQEIKALNFGEAMKNELIKFDLVNESLYEWEVKLMAKAFDNDSPFYHDLLKLDKKFVQFSVEFNAKFPFDPPFIRVVEPVIINGHIESGGALCMEVVMHRGWSPAYSMETLFLQIASTIVRGRGRVNFQTSKILYNRQQAFTRFRWLENHYNPKSNAGLHWNLDKTG